LLPLAGRLKAGASVLDVGCGSGRDLLWLKSRGFAATGFERSPALAEMARKHARCTVIEGDFARHDFSAFRADVMALDLLLILGLSYLHFRLLFWNIREYGLFKQTAAFEKLKNSNNEVALMAIPLTYAMTINVCFVLGAALVPGLWNNIELLFPFALLGFLAVGIYAMRLFLEYGARIIVQKGFDFVNNNNLSQMIAIFAFVMIGVGFAAPGQ
jgi:SAM-dependent methyltransferase